MQTFEISCMRKKHTIIVNDKGQLIFPDHTMEELETEIALMQLGTDKISKCAKVLYQLRNLQKEIKINFKKEEDDLKYFINQKKKLHARREAEKLIRETNKDPYYLNYYLKTRVQNKIKKIIESSLLKQSAYRFANNHWVDSKNTITIINAKKPDIKQRSWRVWSKNGKWSGNSTEVIIIIPLVHWYNNIYKKGLALVDGFFVLDILEETPDHYIVLAGKKGRGFCIEPCKAKINKTNKSFKWLKQA